MSYREPQFKLKYAAKDITTDVKPYAVSIAITDKLEGESDDVEVTLDNSDLRWMDTWLPKDGDRITLTIGYKDAEFLPEVSFEVDEPEYSGVPDLFRLKGQATPITASLRQKNTQAFEKTTLRAIAQLIAEKHGLELIGSDKIPDSELERVTQKNESDLEFLKRLSGEYGLIFKIESCTRLVFYKESELEEAAPVFALKRTDLKSYRIRRSAKGTYQAAEINYRDSKGKYVSVKVDATGAEVVTPKDGETEVESGDVLKIRERCENLEQAKIKATEALRKANRGQIEASIDLEGDTRLAAGINISLKGFRAFSGKYQVTQVRHSLSRRNGYTSSADLKGLELQSEPRETGTA